MHVAQTATVSSIPVHVLCRQVQQSNHDTASKLGIKLGLIVNDMHEAFGEVELHMEVGEVGRNAAPQALQQKTSCEVIASSCTSTVTPTLAPLSTFSHPPFCLQPPCPPITALNPIALFRGSNPRPLLCSTFPFPHRSGLSICMLFHGSKEARNQKEQMYFQAYSTLL